MCTRMPRARRAAASAGALLAAGLLLAGGCTGLEPAAVGAGVTAAESGATFFSRGKLQRMELVRYWDAVDAVQRAAAKLSLEARGTEINDRRARLEYRDEVGQDVVVVVTRRTPTVAHLKADVGAFGKAAVANLLLMQTGQELREMGAYLDEWPTRSQDQRRGAGVGGG